MHDSEHEEPARGDLYATVTGAILDHLERGVVPWRKPWSAAHALPVNAVSGREYRGVNVFLLSTTPYSDHRWLTYKQARELGGAVRKGERASIAVFWKIFTPADDEDATRRIPLLRRYSVFNAEQCEGLELAAPYAPPLAEHERISRADLLARLMPDPPAINEAGASAWYAPGDDCVQVPPLASFRTADSFYATLLHELAHATGHPRRLNRKGISDRVVFGTGDYGHDELVAEFASAFCCASLGLDNSLVGSSASYIANWLKVLKREPRAAVIAAAQAQKAADWIRGKSAGALTLG